MWQEEVFQLEDHKPWDAPCLLDYGLANSAATSFIKPFLSGLLTSVPLQDSPSLNSEESCITSPSECAQSSSKINSRFKNMKNLVSSPGSGVMEDSPDAASPAPLANNWWTSMLLSSTQPQQSSSVAAITDLDTLNWSSDLTIPANCGAVEQLTDSIATTTTSGGHPHIGTSILMDSSSPTGDSYSGMIDNSMWSQVLLGSCNNEAMQSFSVDNMQDALLSRIHHANEFLLADQLKRTENPPTWDLPLRSLTTFQRDDVNVATLDSQHSPNFIHADRLSGTSCTLHDIEAWSPALDHDHNSSLPQNSSINSLSCELELPYVQQYEHSRIKCEYPSSNFPYDQHRLKQGYFLPCLHDERLTNNKQEYPLPGVQNYEHLAIKQADPLPTSVNDHPRLIHEYPLPYTGGNSSTVGGASAPFWLQTFGADTYKSNVQYLSPETGGRPFFRPLAAGSGNNFPASSIGNGFSEKWSEPHCSRLASVLPQAAPSVPVSEQPIEMLAYRSSNAVNLSSILRDTTAPVHGMASERSQYGQQSRAGKPIYDVAPNLLPMGHVEGVRETPSDANRRGGLLTSCESTSEAPFKKPRIEQGPPSLPYKQQPRKEKLGDRITALQQLVSPFGKTDTASVLLEAISYIKFLQEQVQVLSTPYMKTTSTTTTHADGGKQTWNSEGSQDSDEPKLDLRSRGLCLVPVSCTVHIANENGADYWTPSFGAGYR